MGTGIEVCEIRLAAMAYPFGSTDLFRGWPNVGNLTHALQHRLRGKTGSISAFPPRQEPGHGQDVGVQTIPLDLERGPTGGRPVGHVPLAPLVLPLIQGLAEGRPARELYLTHQPLRLLRTLIDKSPSGDGQREKPQYQRSHVIPRPPKNTAALRDRSSPPRSRPRA